MNKKIKMGRPKVSILISFYNLEPYVDETLESVLAQKTDFPFEVICADDGSTDGTVAKIQVWQKCYSQTVRWFVMEREPGREYEARERITRMNNIRKRLFTEAKGDYICFLDGDDLYCDENKLQRQADILDADTKHELIACGHNGDYYWASTGRREPIRPALPECKLTARQYWSFLYIHTNALMFRNLGLQGIDPFASGLPINDNLLTFQMIQYGGIYCLPQRMFLYRQLEGSSFHRRTKYQNTMLSVAMLYQQRRITRSFEISSRMRVINEFEQLYAARRDPQLAREARPYLATLQQDHAGRLLRTVLYAENPKWKQLWCDLEWPAAHAIDRVCRKLMTQGKVRALLEEERRTLELQEKTKGT